MSEESPSVEAAPEGSVETGAVEAGAETSEVSAVAGDAPGDGVDAGGGEVAAPEGVSAEAAAEFLFANRKFKDQRHAEEVLGSEVGRVRGLQRQNADLQKELDALRNQAQYGPRPEQRAPEQKQEAVSFADSLVKSGDIEYFNKLAQNPEIGVGGAIYELAKHLEKHTDERFSKMEEQFQSGTQSIEMRMEQEKALARTFTAAKSLTEEFPELDEGNTSDEAQEAQMAVINLLQQTPQVIHPRTGQPVPQGVFWLAEQPDAALRWAANEYRRQHGVPVMSQPPGTSGSLSGKAAAAAERAGQATATESLDGSGVPKTKSGQSGPKTLADQWREDSSKLKGREAKTPSGRSLGFPA